MVYVCECVSHSCRLLLLRAAPHFPVSPVSCSGPAWADTPSSPLPSPVMVVVLTVPSAARSSYLTGPLELTRCSELNPCSELNCCSEITRCWKLAFVSESSEGEP